MNQLEYSNEFIIMAGDEPRVSSRDIATYLGIEHRSLYQGIILKYKEDFENFGQLLFETATVTNTVGAVNKLKYALLTEDQSYLALAYCRNTKQARFCKQMLVKAFSELRQKEWHKQLQPFRPVTIPEALKQLAQLLDEQEQRLVLLEGEQEKLKNYFRNAPLRSDSIKRAKIQELIRSYARKLGGKPAHYQKAYRRYKAYFDVNTFDDLPLKLYSEALEVLERWIKMDLLK